MKRISKCLVLTLLVSTNSLSNGCGKKEHAAETQNARPVVSVAQPLEREVTDYAEFTGRLEAVDSVQVRARINGHLINVLFKEGAEIKRGDVLFEIDPRSYQAQLSQDQADLQRAEAEARRAQIDFDRLTRVLKDRAASVVEYDTARATLDMAIADVEAAKAAIEASKLNLEFCTIRSPIDGRISNYNVTIGNLVTADQTVLTNIVSVDPIYASFAVDELTYLRVKEAAQAGRTHLQDQAPAPLFLSLANEQDFPHQGTINFADNQLKASTGTIRVRAVFANADRLLTPGMFARVRVPLGPPHPALLVPDRAITSDQGQKIVYVVDENDVVRTRQVIPAAMHDGLRGVESGLKPTERLIIEGMISVRPGEQVRTKSESNESISQASAHAK